MNITFDKSRNIRIIQDCEWISMELGNDFGGDKEACCESRAAITHIATLSGRNQPPLNQFSVEIIQDFGFGREYLYRVYKVGQYCEWQDIREALFNELLEYVRA